MSESSIRTIKNQEKEIRKSAELSFNSEARRVVSKQNANIMKMEAALVSWIKEVREWGVTIDGPLIKEKAKELYLEIAGESTTAPAEVENTDKLQPGPSSIQPFHASAGWFHNFTKRCNLKSVLLHGESSSPDLAAAKYYVESEFPNIIAEGHYQPEQVFNMDETGLFWKRMPSCTYLFKDEENASGFKAHKDLLTLVMCSNAAGFLLKPSLIYKSRNPKALKNKSKTTLPVHWMHHPKVWFSNVLMEEWFFKSFIPQVKDYLKSKGLPFKVLLVMDNAEGHATNLLEEGVELSFFPPNTKSLIQPVDQGIIRTFKAIYTRECFQSLVQAMNSVENFNLKEYWKRYTIASALHNIGTSLKAMKTQTTNASWKKLWRDVVHDYEGFAPEEIHYEAVRKAVQFAKELGGEGFSNMKEEDVNKLIDGHSQALSDADLEELAKAASEEEDKDEEEPPCLTFEVLNKMNMYAREMLKLSEMHDQNMMRSITFANHLASAMAPYTSLLQSKTKATNNNFSDKDI
ncbi:tigger transposable element-derived protein 1-like [Uloborus diversus]|uniref:tigger transposable element-derived protein 1-like n=1 Tax=Uloborus diversus TaxID=327109 RepID=UPI00240917CC|nr:tigger transposable element-derived protein 1-like [Uloborus diversus]